MALERLSREKLGTLLEVDKVDSGNGELFGKALKQDPERSRLMLVVSTGGSGMSSIRQAVRLAGERLKPEYSQFVKFIILDSDTGALEAFDHYTNVLPLNISTPGAKVRLQPEHRSNFQKKFIPQDFNAGVLNNDGSNQMRMVGKIKLYDQDKSGATFNDLALEKLVGDLFLGDWLPYQNLEVDLIVLSGLSGGNGSGTFVDIPVHVKKACPNPSRMRTFGFLMLPDTAEGFASSLTAKNSLYANGYAALKELESYMSIVMEKDRKEIFQSSDGTTMTIDNTNLLYDYPILLSGDYYKVVNMVGETLVNMMASNVDPNKANDPNAQNGGQFDMFSFFSNNSTAQSNVFAHMGQQGRLTDSEFPEDSHSYCGIGFSAASIPEKVVIPNAVSKVSKRLFSQEEIAAAAAHEEGAAVWCSTGKYLSNLEFSSAIAQLLSLPEEIEAQESSLWTNKIAPLIENKLGLLGENPWDVTYEDLVEGRFEDYLKGFKVEEVAHKGADKVVDEINGLYQSLYVQAQQLVKKYGPRVMEYLYNGDGGVDENGAKRTYKTCLASQIEYVETQLNAMKQKKAERPGRVENKGIFSKIVDVHIKKETVPNWKSEAKEWAETSVKSIIAGFISGNNNSFAVDFKNKVLSLRDCCIRFADILEQMQNFYAGAGSTLDAATFDEFSKKAGELNSVNLCSDSQTYRWVKDSVDAKVRSVDLDQLRQALADSFFSQKGMGRWTSAVTGEARKIYDEVFSTACQIGVHTVSGTELSLSIADYFNEKLKDAKSEPEKKMLIEAEARNIMRRLLTGSKPSLKLSENSEAPVTNVTVMLPSSLYTAPNGKQIFEAFQEQVKSITGTGVNNVIDSSAVDQIVCYQTSVANALSNLSDIDKWEDAYNKDTTKTIHLNNGEYETEYTEIDMRTRQQRKELPESLNISDEDNMLGTTGLSWRHYPAINAKLYDSQFTSFGALAKAGHENIEKGYEARYRADVFSRKIEYALREKLIELEREGNIYRYYLNILPEDWTNLSLAGAPSTVQKGSKLFEYLGSQNMGSHTQWPANHVNIALSGTPYFGGQFDATTLLNNEPGRWTDQSLDDLFKSYMMRIMRKNIYLYRELEKTILRYFPVRIELDERAEKEKYVHAASRFAELYVFGIVSTDPKQEVWKVQVSPIGGTITIMQLDFVTKMGLPAPERELIKQKFSSLLAVRAFQENCEKGAVKDEALDKVKAKILSKAPEDFQEQVETRAAQLQGILEHFAEYTEEEDEPQEKLMELLKLDVNSENVRFVDMLAQIIRGLKQGLENLPL